MKKLIKSIHPKLLFKPKPKPKSSPLSFTSSSHSYSTTTTSSVSDTSTHHHHRTHSTDTLPYKFDTVSAFNMIDTDGDGKITRVELESLFTRLNGGMPISPHELQDMINEIDRDGDGCISLDELQTVGSVFESTAQEHELRGAFQFFDVDHDGKIDVNELYEGLLKLGVVNDRCTLEDCRRIIDTVDVNHDGFVCFQDFSRMMDVIPT